MGSASSVSTSDHHQSCRRAHAGPKEGEESQVWCRVPYHAHQHICVLYLGKNSSNA
jgi:hypothetical protein